MERGAGSLGLIFLSVARDERSNVMVGQRPVQTAQAEAPAAQTGPHE